MGASSRAVRYIVKRRERALGRWTSWQTVTYAYTKELAIALAVSIVSSNEQRAVFVRGNKVWPERVRP